MMRPALAVIPLLALPASLGLLCSSVRATTLRAIAEPVEEAALNQIRGGVLLPNGLSLDIGIDIQTQVNGVLALHTVLSTAAPAADQLRVYSGGAPPSNASVASVNLTNGAPPSLILNRAGSTTQLQTIAPAGNPVVLVANAPIDLWPMYPNEPRVDVASNGQPAKTAQGAIQVHQAGGETAVSLAAGGLSITHLLGQSTGVVIGNQLNDQIIQSTTVVDVDLHGSWTTVANALFSVGSLAVNSVRRP